MRAVGFLAFAIFILFASPVLAVDEKTSEKPADAKSGFLSKINFEKGTFLGDTNIKFMALVEKIEKWRLEKKDSIKSSLDKIETRREDAKDPKPAVKVMTIIHISGLAIALFVFSLQFVFWTASILIAIFIIRRLVHFIIGLFHRRPIQA